MTILTVAQAATRPVSRIATGVRWFDALTSGGLVAGSATLVYGEPGAGKSTMLAQVAGLIPRSLYVALEEDLSMVAARFRRLGLYGDTLLTDERDIGVALQSATGVAVIDSLQLSLSGALEAAETAVRIARERRLAVILVCHAIKSGMHAGPRTIEHLVDMTLRVMREPRGVAIEKNRFGQAGVWVALEMTAEGLQYGAAANTLREQSEDGVHNARRRFGRRGLGNSSFRAFG